MALRHLQLFRNSGTTFTDVTRSQAKSKAEGQKNSLKDGDVIAARYTSSGVISVAVGHKVNDVIVWNDPQEIKEMVSASTASTENLEKAVGVAHNASAITFGETTNYIGTSGSASGALVTLDTQLKTTDDLAKQVQAAVGSSANTLNVQGNYVNSGDTVKVAVTSLDANLKTVSSKTDDVASAFDNYATQVVGRASGSTGLGASGSNITTADTVQSAVQKLDKAIESGDTANDNLRKAVGAAEGASAMTYPNTNYIVSDKTVSGALVTLDTKLHTVSGDLDTLEGVYAEYTAATDANTAATRTMATNLDTVVGVASGATTLGVDGNYVKASGTVKEDITVLDSKLQEVSASSTTDVENLRKAVGVQSGESAITITGAHYATGKNVVSALTQLDTQLYSATTSVDKAHSLLGTTSGDSSFNASGHYVSGKTTAKAAIEALDTNLTTVSGKADSALTYTNNLSKVVGVAETDTALNATGKYVSGSTVKVALQNLNNAIVSAETANDNLEKAVGVAHNASAITFGNTNYIGTSGSASGALVTLDSTIKGVRDDVNTVSGKVDNAQTALGSTGTTLGASGSYVNSGMTVKTAVQKLDTVEKATRDTIGGMNAEGTSGLSLNGQHYISGDTTVVSALTDLDTNLYELSGSVSANKIVATDTIAVTTAESGTSLDVKISETATEPSTSASEEVMHGNIISATTDGLVAFADIHYSAAENTLEFVNTYGKRRIPLTGVKVFDNVTYDSTTEKIILSYTDLSGGTKTVEIPVSGIIEEFQFNGSDQSGATPASSGQHNVSLVGTHVVDGATQVYGELSIFDCGTY